MDNPGYIDTKSIRARVMECGLFKTVTFALDMSEAMGNPGAFAPAAFVLLPEERSEPSRIIGPHRQEIFARIAVAFVIGRQAAVDRVDDRIEANRQVLRQHLAGWRPDGAHKPLDYLSSAITNDQRGFTWVTLIFDTKYMFRGSN